MKENDPLIVMTHTLIENSAPRPQLYQQVRPAKGFAPPHPHQSLLLFWSVVQCSSSGVQFLMASWDWSPCIVCIASTSSSIAFDCSPLIVRSHANMGMTCKRVVRCVCIHCSVKSLCHSQVCVWGELDKVLLMYLENTKDCPLIRSFNQIIYVTKPQVFTHLVSSG